MGSLGRNVPAQRSGYDPSIIAGADVEWLMGGVTFDWDLVTAVSVDTTLTDGRVVRSGQKYLRYGQVVTRITGAASTVATLNNTPTGGTATYSVTSGGSTQTTSGIAYNATGATLQTAIRALSNVNVATTVTGSAGGPYTFTVPSSMGTTTVTANGASLTGAGAQPTVTFVQGSDGRISWFGPFDPNATDGRQTLHRGDIGLVNKTIVQGGTLGQNEVDDTHFGVIVGGHVYKGLVPHTGTASHTLAGGPTQAELEAAMPTLVLQSRT